MSEKKSLVIKVKYPVSESRSGGGASSPQVITEWNKKRIFWALFGLVLIISGLFYVFSREDSQRPAATVAMDSKETIVAGKIEPGQITVDQKNQTVASSETVQMIAHPKAMPHEKANASKPIVDKEVAKAKPVEHQKITPKQLNKNIARALITYQVNNKEPGREIGREVLINKNPSWIYYFTELKQMRGQTVYHEWIKDNIRVSRHELNIASDTWRTSSRKLLSESSKGQWTVRLLDQDGHVLNEKKFKVNSN